MSGNIGSIGDDEWSGNIGSIGDDEWSENIGSIDDVGAAAINGIIDDVESLGDIKCTGLAADVEGTAAAESSADIELIDDVASSDEIE